MERFVPYLLLLVAAIGLGVTAWVFSNRLKRKEQEIRELAGEEERMFDYLHDLGLAIGADTTQTGLYRMIVEGVNRVVAAKGGALYLLDDAGEVLVPRFLSEDCAAMVAVPDEVMKKAELDPRALASHLRLAGVPASEGLLGAALTAGDALHVPGGGSGVSLRETFGLTMSEAMSVMVSPLKHGGKDLGVLAVARTDEAGGFNANDFAVFRSAAEQSAFALGNALLYREAHEKRLMESELRNASEVQRVLLPQGEPAVPGYRISGANVPARIISGDYYDYLNLGDGLHGIVIADVSGKGVAAGLMMAMCRSVLRMQAVGHRDPQVVLDGVNRQLFPDIREDMFISLFYGVIDGDSGVLRLARAGHDAAVLYRAADRTIEEIKPPGLALGVDEGDVFERVTKVMELKMETGDCLLFYTDGVKEAVDAGGEEFGMQRLRTVFLDHAALGAEATVRGMQRELARFSGEAPQMDDITLLAVEKR